MHTVGVAHWQFSLNCGTAPQAVLRVAGMDSATLSPQFGPALLAEVAVLVPASNASACILLSVVDSPSDVSVTTGAGEAVCP